MLRTIGAALVDLVPGDRPRGWFLVALAVPLQVGFWYLATPGPTLLRFAARVPREALLAVALSAAFLLAIPWILTPLIQRTPFDLGLRANGPATGRGFAVAGVLFLLALPFLWLGAGTSALQSTYPWAGSWVGSSWTAWILWSLAYGIYYLSFEFFYRGLLLFGLAEAWGERQAQWVQAAFATLVHVGKPLSETLAAFPASLLFGALALRSRSILPVVALHWGIGVATDLFVLIRSGQFLSG